jgi:hypothetical protein
LPFLFKYLLTEAINLFICGNCNGNYSDDLQTKDGTDVSSSGRRGNSDIGNSYKVFDDVEDPDSRLLQHSRYFAQCLHYKPLGCN